MESINPQTPVEPPAGAPKPLRILFADDSENDVLIIMHALRKAGYALVHERVWTAAAMQAALQNPAWEIVVSDYEMPGFGGFEALELVKASGRDLPFILVSAVVSEEIAVAAMKAGAHDYMMKRKLARLGPAIERELRDAKTRTARKAAETALKQSEEQLRQAQKLEAVARLAAGVAHDFNNILTAISGHSMILLRELKEGDPRRINAGQIEKCAYRAATLTRQLLTFSRKQAIKPRVININDIVRGLERMLRRLIGEDIEFRQMLDAAAGNIKADIGQLEQVLTNLCVNARDAMPNGGRITVFTANVTVDDLRAKDARSMNAGDYVMVAVADTGTGMTEEVKAHLFEPFFTTKPPGKGTGLGLATSFGIVKENSGHIELESEVGKGTTFKIYFPQVWEAVASTASEKDGTRVRGGAETVLVVEDEAIVRELAATDLRERGYAVMEAGDGEEGLRIASRHQGKIDLVLTDIVMPVMGGKEMADALHRSHPDMKFLFTSGYSEEVIGNHGLIKQNIEFLQKPYMTATLGRRVREVLDKS
jgi:two-component system cell cycle sensor histidine kinase/response regulator CckA